MVEASLEDLKIMLVESHRPTRRVLESVTAALRIQTPMWLEDPVEGPEAISQDTPDLLILGQGLATFDSLNLVEWVRQDPDKPFAYLPIIFMTPDCSGQAQDGAELARMALDRGVHKVLCRPISPDSLRDTISAVVERPPPFIKAESYFGPDRRWQNRDSYSGPDRRSPRVRTRPGGDFTAS